jgi:hypothetical protein
MIFQTSGAMSIRNFNGLSLLVLFVGGYFATVLMAWAVLLLTMHLIRFDQSLRCQFLHRLEFFWFSDCNP